VGGFFRDGDVLKGKRFDYTDATKPRVFLRLSNAAKWNIFVQETGGGATIKRVTAP